MAYGKKEPCEVEMHDRGPVAFVLLIIVIAALLSPFALVFWVGAHFF